MIKLYQIFYKNEQIPYLDNAFIPYNNIENPRPQECEFYIFLKEYMNGNIKDGDIAGYFSWKFKQKSQVNGEDFKSFIESNPGNDLYFVNPYSFNMYIFYNTWIQGLSCHHEIIDLAKDIFSKVGYDPDLIIKQRHHINNSTFCNYWAGSKNFWDRYIKWCNPIYDYIKSNKDPMFQHKMFVTDLGNNLGYFPYIIERLVNTFINLPENSDLKVIHYPSDIYTNSWVDVKKYLITFKNLVDSIDERKEYTDSDLLFLYNANKFYPITAKLKI